jgi:predicted ferric reductase
VAPSYGDHRHGADGGARADHFRRHVPVGIFGPHGRFDYRGGGQRQVWIAAGVGITPFHSWIRSLESSFDREVQFFYTTPDTQRALFADEITAVARAIRRYSCT